MSQLRGLAPRSWLLLTECTDRLAPLCFLLPRYYAAVGRRARHSDRERSGAGTSCMRCFACGASSASSQGGGSGGGVAREPPSAGASSDAVPLSMSCCGTGN